MANILDKAKKIMKHIKKVEYTNEVIDKMIKNNNYDFIDYIDDDAIIDICEKYNSNAILKEMLKKDFFRIYKIIELIDGNIWLFSSQEIFYKDLFEEMLKLNYHETLKFLEENPNKTYGLLTNSDYLNITDILIKNGFSNDDYKKIIDVIIEPFLLALLKNNAKKTLVSYDDHRLSSFLHSSNIKMVKKICDVFSSLRLEDLPKDALENKKILTHYVKDENQRELIYNIVTSISYSKENEIKLLGMFDNRFNSVEELINNMYYNENNKRRDDMSIYEILAIQIYAQKYLKKKNINTCDINMFKYSNETHYGTSSMYSYTHTLGVMNHNHTIIQLIRVLHHELAHVEQRELIHNMDIKADRDVDLYTKDNLLKICNIEVKDNFVYYNGNYSYLSVEYYAEYNSFLETSKLFGKDNVCYDKFKLDTKSLPEEFSDMIVDNEMPSYYYDVNRKNHQGEVIHINDLVELHLDSILKDEELREKIKKEAPLILYEYDISKDEVPRRRTIEELINLLNNSESEKEKDIYLMLLINRFDGRKEKEEDVKKSKEEVLKLFNEGKISSTQKELLLSSIIENDNSTLQKSKLK